MRLLGYRSSAPYICGVCGRLASGVGYIKPNERKPDILWTCEKHVHLAERVFKMSQTKLTQYENAAIARAVEYLSSELVDDMLTIMWESGLRSMEELNGEKVKEIEGVVRKHDGIKQIFETFLLRYSANLGKILSGDEPPF